MYTIKLEIKDTTKSNTSTRPHTFALVSHEGLSI